MNEKLQCRHQRVEDNLFHDALNNSSPSTQYQRLCLLSDSAWIMASLLRLYQNVEVWHWLRSMNDYWSPQYTLRHQTSLAPSRTLQPRVDGSGWAHITIAVRSSSSIDGSEGLSRLQEVIRNSGAVRLKELSATQKTSLRTVQRNRQYECSNYRSAPELAELAIILPASHCQLPAII